MFVLVATYRFNSIANRKVSMAITLNQVENNPYSVRAFRCLIDYGAFKIYGHWVKRDEQNRGLLFENEPKRDVIRAAERYGQNLLNR